MSEVIKQYKAFIEAIAKNPYDRSTRLVFADFLEEHGLDEDALGQREWTREKQEAEDFLRKLAFDLSMTWEEFLANGNEIATGEFCFGDDDSPGVMSWQWDRFKKAWPVFTGKEVPDMDLDGTSFHCSC